MTQGISKDNVLMKNINKFLENKFKVHLLPRTYVYVNPTSAKISDLQDLAISHYLAHNVPDLLSVDDVRGVDHSGVAGPLLLSIVLVLSL